MGKALRGSSVEVPLRSKDSDKTIATQWRQLTAKFMQPNCGWWLCMMGVLPISSV